MCLSCLIPFSVDGLQSGKLDLEGEFSIHLNDSAEVSCTYYGSMRITFCCDQSGRGATFFPLRVRASLLLMSIL